jgi:membrane-associated protease RseP (regulator of RpoE activity)
MFRHNFFFVTLLMFLGAVSLAAGETVIWRVPRYLSSAAEAAEKLRFMAPRLAPYGKNGHSLSNLDIGRLGINFSFSDGSVVTLPYGKTAAARVLLASEAGLVDSSTSRPGTRDSCLLCSDGVAVYAGDPLNAPWCLIVATGQDKETQFTGRICLGSEPDAEALVDVLETIAVAHGADPFVPTGASLSALGKGALKKIPDHLGMDISINLHSPEAAAGIQYGDVLHTVNGTPCTDADVYQSATSKAYWHAPDGGVVHLEVLRRNKPLNVDVHYPYLGSAYDKDTISKLQRTAAESAQDQAPQAPAAGLAPAPPAGVHFGIQVRPVIADDMAPLALTKAQGLVVVGVENGGLADTMGILAGDVILQLNGADVGNMQQFVQTIRSGAASSFRVWRKGQTVELTVPMSM